jgi:hypothetical protein
VAGWESLLCGWRWPLAAEAVASECFLRPLDMPRRYNDVLRISFAWCEAAIFRRLAIQKWGQRSSDGKTGLAISFLARQLCDCQQHYATMIAL